MNTEAIKTELQQVLDSDLALRKEYNEIKRSLSDYRNQLIQRDEDCKRLQVSIDVLNTKLVVMERDNTNYKGEVASFKELRNTIREQLQEKQDEITGLLSTIEGLNTQLASISSEYEQKISAVQASSQTEIANISSSYENQINELRTNTTYQQSGIRTELEAKIAELTLTHNTTLQESTSSYEAKIATLKAEHSSQLETINSQIDQKIASINETNVDVLGNLKSEYEIKINDLSFEWANEKKELTQSYESKIETLTAQFSEEKSTIISSFESKISNLNSEIESLQSGFSSEKSGLTSTFENQIATLTEQLEAKQTEFDLQLNTTIENLNQSFTQKETEIRNEYELKLLSTANQTSEQNSQLTESINTVMMENEHFKEKIREMVYHIDAQNSQIESLSNDIVSKSSELSLQLETNGLLTNEFQSYKQDASASAETEITNLNVRLSELDETISLKDASISELSVIIENNNTEIARLNTIQTSLQNEITALTTALNDEKENSESIKNELELNYSQELKTKEVEFNKLIAENTSLISEIDTTSDQLDVVTAELDLVKTELAEIKSVSEGRATDLKETLQNKNYELTNLSANNMALQTELDILKAELENTKTELRLTQTSSESLGDIQGELNRALNINKELEFQAASFASQVENLNSIISEKDTEITNLKSVTKVDEQEAFIDRLFKQIDVLSDERLSLLSEKEQMATQLLKMNDTISTISQQVDSHEIDVTVLDNHRKNVILAKSSSNEVSADVNPMKKQISELVREIDKCIALLSA